MRAKNDSRGAQRHLSMSTPNATKPKPITPRRLRCNFANKDCAGRVARAYCNHMACEAHTFQRKTWGKSGTKPKHFLQMCKACFDENVTNDTTCGIVLSVFVIVLFVSVFVFAMRH
jgi:hypothetical protein